MIELKKLGFRFVVAEWPQCPIIHTNTDKSTDPSFHSSKNLQKSPYWKLLAAPRSKILKALISNKSERTTPRFKQTEKKKKENKNLPTPSKPTYRETRIKIPSLPETCFHRCNVPCRVKKCDFSSNLRIYTAEIQERNAYKKG